MKTFIRILCLSMALLTLFCSIGASAAIVYKEGTTVVFHNQSPYYIYNGDWIKGNYYTEESDGILYVAIEDFKNAFKCNITYNYNDTSIYVKLADKSLWQGLGYDTIFISGTPFSAPAPYISSKGNHPVMIPLWLYATQLGYSGSYETPKSYPAGQMIFKTDPVPYTLIRVEVNQAAQLVNVIGQSPDGRIAPVKHMLCSTGIGSATPNGTFRINALYPEWYYFSRFNCYVRYCSQISGDICFHSLTFNTRSNASLSSSAYKNIGTKASHGCIRLFIEDAKFIHQQCNGLPVVISNGYTNSDTSAIRDDIISAKPSYSDYVNSLY